MGNGMTIDVAERMRELLNSLGIAGPNIRHEEQVEPDPKWDRDERAVWEMTKDQMWCVCGREWPCEARQLAGLVDLAEEYARAALGTPASPPKDRQTAPNFGTPTGVECIATERQRQIDVEGYDPEHDEDAEALALAAVAYALPDGPMSYWIGGRAVEADALRSVLWPWDDDAWKPKDTLRNLVRAGALIAAAIDALARLDAKPSWSEASRRLMESGDADYTEEADHE